MGRRIEEMVVVITGASSGIGKALAVELARKRARLVLAARRGEKLEQLNVALGGKHLAVTCNVARSEECERLIATAMGRFGRIDTLVCNAGYGIVRTVADTTPQEMRDMFATNVFGTSDCVRAAVRVMAKQSEDGAGVRGQVVIVSSAAARRGLPYFGAYSATKSAQLGLAEALRVELRPKGIAVTSVHPIGTETAFFRVAERLGGAGLPEEVRRGVRQTAEQVARRIARAIASPVAELWPFDAARWATSVGTIVPRVVDRFMERARCNIEACNRAET